eukprot:1619112-Rhodomonas_salina.2
MQHFVHGRVEKEPFAKFGDLHDEWCRQNQETRRSWTAPTLFGRDTIAVSPGGTALGKSKVNPHTEAAFYQNRHVPGPDGAKMRFWVPPLSFARFSDLRTHRLETARSPRQKSRLAESLDGLVQDIDPASALGGQNGSLTSRSFRGKGSHTAREV